MTSITRAAAGMAVAVASTLGHAQDQVEHTRPDPADIDLSEPTLFVVGYAHLDTQWRWTYYDTIREFIPNTLKHNFDRFEKYPGYVFNFGGSRRFRMMEEYYPEYFETLKKYVADGRWFPSGSSVDENDANVPSGESQIRQVLYGNKYTRDAFGVTSSEFMLPDCFGFPAALPSLLAHSGLKGFSTQKLTWNAVTPIPFKVGVWEGPDGNSIIAALDPGAYVADVRTDLSKDDSWFQRINNNGEASGVYVDYHYYGVGDQGGAPREPSVALVEQSVANSQNEDAKINVIAQRADLMFEAITPEQRASLPAYTGELQLIEHSAGSISSQAYMKRWNRKNEQLADAAEKAAVGAMLLGARDYPGQRLQDAWELVLGSQMHDILPGTSVPLAYDLSWNDEVIAANQFGAVLADSASAIISAMDTNAEGTPIVVFNPLSWDRHDLVEAEIPYEGDAPKSVVVLNPEGNTVPAQVLWAENGYARIAFTATVPSIGFATFDARLSEKQNAAASSETHITPDGRFLENGFYTVKLNERGDVESIFDKRADTELLSAPARIGLHYENPSQWPAWNMDWSDRQLPAKAFVGETGPVSFKVIESGPARVAVEVTREAEGSIFTQRISLASAGTRIEFDTDIDWKTRERSVRAAFPLTASNPSATYDIHLGTTERGNGHPNQYEYLFHQWFDLTDTSGDFGTTVMCDSKYAADKPDDNTVRLTLLFTPGVRGGYPDQQSQDIGRHNVRYAVQGHTGDWRKGRSFANAAGLNQPLIPFRTTSHSGDMGKSVSLLSLSSDTVSVQAMKKAEDTDEIIIRLREHAGQAANNVLISSDLGPVARARFVDGQERHLADIDTGYGAITTDIGGYGLQAIALAIDHVVYPVEAPRARALELPYDTDAISANAHRGAGGMTNDGRSYPAEQLPSTLTLGGVEFELGTEDGNNAMACRGQELSLPGGDFDRLYLLLASSDGDAHAFVNIDGDEHYLTAQAWDGYVGQWDHREWPGDVTDPRYPWGRSDIIGLTPGFVKPDEIAWYASHHHADGEDAIYRYSYLFRKAIELSEGTRTITLPDDPRIKIFAASVAQVGPTAEPARELFDTLADHVQQPPVIEVAGVPTGRNGSYTDTIEATIEPSLYWQPGSFHYTTDGSVPTTNSPVYSGPILVSQNSSIRTAAVDADGNLGPAQSRMIRVVDETAPSVRGVLAMYEMPQIRIEFSEPVQELGAGNFSLEPSIAVERVAMDDDGRGATIELASVPVVGRPCTLHIKDVRDGSPAENILESDRHTFVISGPVYSMETIEKDQYGTTIENTPGLPVKASDSWTINVWAKMDAQPTNHTVLVGFGNCDASNGGQARYLTKFASGVHMWSHNQDVPSRTQYDTGRWQMVTATYDGRVGRLYKDGKLIGQRTVRLSDDANLIQIAPLDPWDRRYQFEGDLAGLTIWDQALTERAIGTLHRNAPR